MALAQALLYVLDDALGDGAVVGLVVSAGVAADVFGDHG